MKLRNFLTTSFILTSTSVLAGTYTCEPCPVGKYLTSSGTCSNCSGNSTTAWAVGSNTNPTCGFATRTVTKYCQASGSTTSTANPVSTQEVTYKGNCGTNQVCDGGSCKDLNLTSEKTCSSGYFKSSNGECKPIFYLYGVSEIGWIYNTKTYGPTKLNSDNDSFTYINEDASYCQQTGTDGDECFNIRTFQSISYIYDTNYTKNMESDIDKGLEDSEYLLSLKEVTKFFTCTAKSNCKFHNLDVGKCFECTRK